jgi:hypothetical protein
MKGKFLFAFLFIFCLLMVTALRPCSVSAVTPIPEFNARISIRTAPLGFQIEVDPPFSRVMQTGDVVIKYYTTLGTLLLKDIPDLSNANNSSCECYITTLQGVFGSKVCINVRVINEAGNFVEAWFSGNIEWSVVAYPPFPYIASLSQDDGGCSDPLATEIEKLKEIHAKLSSGINQHNIYLPMAQLLVTAIEKALNKNQKAFAATIAAETRLSLAAMAMRTVTSEVVQALKLFEYEWDFPGARRLVRAARIQYVCGRKELAYVSLKKALDETTSDAIEPWDMYEALNIWSQILETVI